MVLSDLEVSATGATSHSLHELAQSHLPGERRSRQVVAARFARGADVFVSQQFLRADCTDRQARSACMKALCAYPQGPAVPVHQGSRQLKHGDRCLEGREPRKSRAMVRSELQYLRAGESFLTHEVLPNLQRHDQRCPWPRVAG